MLKILIGSLVGAILATLVFCYLKVYLISIEKVDLLIWFPIFTGILTGLMARWIGGPLMENSKRVVTGSIAALLAAAAMFGHEVGPPLWDAWTVNQSPIKTSEVTAKPILVVEPLSESSPNADSNEAEADDRSGVARQQEDAATQLDPANDRPRKPPALVGMSAPNSDSAEAPTRQDQEGPGPTASSDSSSQSNVSSFNPLKVDEEQQTQFQQVLTIIAYAIGVLLAFQIPVCWNTKK